MTREELEREAADFIKRYDPLFTMGEQAGWIAEVVALAERYAAELNHIPQAEKKVGGDTEMPILHDCCEATCQVCGKVNWVVGGDTGAKE